MAKMKRREFLTIATAGTLGIPSLVVEATACKYRYVVVKSVRQQLPNGKWIEAESEVKSPNGRWTRKEIKQNGFRVKRVKMVERVEAKD